MQKKSQERDQFTVVLEDLNSKFKVFGEGLNGLSEKVDKQGVMIGTVQSDLGLVQSDVAFIKVELSLIRHNQAARGHYHLLERRVSKLEKK